MSIKICFDLDGTLFDLYGRENWLLKLENELPYVFTEWGERKGWINFDRDCFYNKLFELMSKGASFAVITWLPFAISPEYEEICRREKMEWIKKNLPMINEIYIIPYGIDKQKALEKRASQMILIDDNKAVCESWQTAKQRKAFQVTKGFTALDALYAIEEEYL